MKFTAKGIEYNTDVFGVVHQLNPQPFVYDPKYVSTYDTPQYQKNSEILQALRYSYACGAHGRPIKSLIDVGFGNGAFMQFARSLTPLVGGMDISTVPVPEGCFFTDKILPVEVVTFFDSIEHIPDLMFVRGIPAETIIISLPYCHLQNRGINWFENDYYHLKVNEHLHHFDQDSLEKFMDNMGWYRVCVSRLEDVVRKRDPEWNILTCAFKRKKEVWLPVKGWEDKYHVSSFGRVKSLSRKIGWGNGYYSRERILQEQNDGKGYKSVSFPAFNRKNYTMRVHRLVADAFVLNPDNKPTVNHKNGVRWHNYATNIEWSTVAENVQHGFDYNGRTMDQSARRKPIKQLTDNGELVRIWESGVQVEKEGGFDRSVVLQAIRDRKNYYGFKWEYA